MRLHKFLNEAFATSISKDDAVFLIKTECMKNYKAMKKSGNWIYRGDGALSSDFYCLDKRSRGTRKSANTSNEYTELFSKYLSSWKGLPRRDKAIVCSTDRWKARNYGHLFYAIPFDNTPIAVASARDFWDSFPNLIKTLNIDGLDYFNEFFRHNLVFKGTTKIESNIKKKLSWKVTDLDLGDYEEELAYLVKDKSKTVEEVLNSILDPKKNGIKVLKSCSGVPSEALELWFDGSCILVDGDEMYEILQDM